MIDLFYPYVPKEAINEVADTLKTKWIAQGPKVVKFENDFSTKFKVDYPVTVSSGTSALETAYDLIGLKPGDEVVVTPLTCTATNLPLLARGCKLIWADILKDTLCIDPSDVKKKISSRTKAIVQVHLGGLRSDPKNDLAELKIPIVSDAAQSLGTFAGDYTCCSFQAIKHITTGDGGMIVLNNADEYRKAKLMRWFGIDRDKKVASGWSAFKERQMTFDIEIQGYKRHMNDISAVMGIHGLRHYDEIISHRQKLMRLYQSKLKGIDGIKILDNEGNTYWLCTVLVKRRDDFVKKMHEAGIETNMVQIRNDIYKIFGGVRQDLPVMNEIEDEYLSLPIGHHITEGVVTYICDTIEKGW